MALNRGPFNALIDDDGSGTTGSPWNKPAIAGVLLDPMDAEIARLGAPFSGQLPFPASPNYSSDPNTLDFYQEGTFTPMDANGIIVFTTAVGSYVKIGQLVLAMIRVIWPTTGYNAPAILSGLPFPINSSPGGGWVGATSYSDGPAGITGIVGGSAATWIDLYVGSSPLLNMTMSAKELRMGLMYRAGT